MVISDLISAYTVTRSLDIAAPQPSYLMNEFMALIFAMLSTSVSNLFDFPRSWQQE